MFSRNAARLTQTPILRQTTRQFASSTPLRAKNRIFNPVTRPEDLTSYLSLSTSASQPLLTFWTASYCSTCRTVLPLLKELLSSGVGEAEGGVHFCEIEFDSMDIMKSGLANDYAVSSMPTLLSFQKGRVSTRETDPRRLRDREVLGEWVREEARKGRAGDGGASGGWFS